MEYYDVGTSDLKELWDSYLAEPALAGQDILLSTRDDEWSTILCHRENRSSTVVIRDRLMTDAALGGPRPIKSEHSYSMLSSSPSSSSTTSDDNPQTSNPGSSAVLNGSTTSTTNSTIDTTSLSRLKSIDIRSRIDDMEEECFPAISMNTASGRGASSPPPSPAGTNTRNVNILPESNDCTEIKEEPMSAPGSPDRCSSITEEANTIAMISAQSVHMSKTSDFQMSDSDDDEEEYQSMDLDEYAETCGENQAELHASRQALPPTPPSSASSDSEGTVSASCSPERRDSQSSAHHVQNLRGLLAPRLYITNNTHSTRQPIHTPLISCQPKGSTGVLVLTEEEKRTLIAEGYPVPTKLPLTKQEEKSLKKVRRKIKNKISAQESRRKKKEYMDGLERRVTILTNENSSYRDKLTNLEDANRELLKELQRLKNLLQLQNC